MRTVLKLGRDVKADQKIVGWCCQVTYDIDILQLVVVPDELGKVGPLKTVPQAWKKTKMMRRVRRVRRVQGREVFGTRGNDAIIGIKPLYSKVRTRSAFWKKTVKMATVKVSLLMKAVSFPENRVEVCPPSAAHATRRDRLFGSKNSATRVSISGRRSSGCVTRFEWRRKQWFDEVYHITIGFRFVKTMTHRQTHSAHEIILGHQGQHRSASEEGKNDSRSAFIQLSSASLGNSHRSLSAPRISASRVQFRLIHTTSSADAFWTLCKMPSFFSSFSVDNRLSFPVADPTLGIDDRASASQIGRC